MSISIPGFYVSKNADYFDAAYTKSYIKSVKTAGSNSDVVIVSTPWKVGTKGKYYYFNPFLNKDPRKVMRNDFLKLSLNFPNKTLQEDLKIVFGRE